jgi:hypothetical protein
MQQSILHLHAGMGGYVALGPDRLACTVVEVARRNREVVVQYDRALQLWSDRDVDAHGTIDPWNQDYAFERNPKGRRETFTLRRKDGVWFRKGELSGPGAARLYLGERRHWADPVTGCDGECGRFVFAGGF